jgi:hypothetical protein
MESQIAGPLNISRIMLTWKVRKQEQIASHKSKNYFMKSKYFSNDFKNKSRIFS